MLNQMKKLTQEFNFDLREEKWRFSEIFEEEGLYSDMTSFNGPQPDSMFSPIFHSSGLLGKYLYYHM